MRRPEALKPIALRIERRFAAPPEVVWACLTRPKMIARWFFAVDFRPAVGHRFRIEGPAVDGWRGWTHVEVLEVDPPRRMVWRFDCTDAAPPSRVTFQLSAKGDGAQLLLSHDGHAPNLTVGLLEGGWSQYLTRLGGLAEDQLQSGRGIAR